MPAVNNDFFISSPVHSALSSLPDSESFSWNRELRQIFSYKCLNILWWPVFKHQQRHFTSSAFFKFCNALPVFPNLWKTIQKGSYAYNSLFLRINPFHRSSGFTDLADVTTLALFFGDEFIDGICVTAGKPCIRRLVNENAGKFFLEKTKKGNSVKLELSFDITKLLPYGIMQEINPKYQITYQTFYFLLLHFLQLVNNYIAELPLPKAHRAADKIIDVCNTCFNSYLHDVSSCPVQDQNPDISKVLHFHESKTRWMQRKLLELRCTLVEKEDIMNNRHSQGWLDMMTVVQIYDDMQDVVNDDGFQDNLLLCTARYYFPGEWDWFSNHKHLLHQVKHNGFLLSLFMPASVHYCLQIAADKIKTMSWEQQKITHYLLFKNWFISTKSKYLNEHFSTSLSIDRFLLQTYQSVKDKMPHLGVQSIKSFAIETCFHSEKIRTQLLLKIDLSTAYQLRYNLLSVSRDRKAIIFDRITSGKVVKAF